MLDILTTIFVIAVVKFNAEKNSENETDVVSTIDHCIDGSSSYPCYVV